MAKTNPGFTYQLAPRAKIYRRDQGNVKDMESMKAIMRYNGKKNIIQHGFKLDLNI